MEERKKILEETKCKRNESFGIEKIRTEQNREKC